MDIYSGIVYWFLMLFVQFAPSAELTDGAEYSYRVAPGERTIIVTVAAENNKRMVSARYGEDSPYPHQVVLEMRDDVRHVLSVLDGTSEMCDAPFDLPSDGLMLSTDPGYKFLPAEDGSYKHNNDTVQVSEEARDFKLTFSDFEVSVSRIVVEPPEPEPTPSIDSEEEPAEEPLTEE